MAFAVWLAGCWGGDDKQSTRAAYERGGTLRVGAVNSFGDVSHVGLSAGFDYALDPQVVYEYDDWDLARCCLLRTLLSYNGRPTRDGGTEVRPDLASGMPEVSPDGLTWTFRLKPGIRYGPPFEDTEIRAEDIVRAIERVLAPSPPGAAPIIGPYLGTSHFYFLGVIAGTEEFANGDADAISGLETPDDHTLVVHLNALTGDLGYRFTLPATAPIPPNPHKPRARFGVAEGHERGYGRFLVASGPYMIEGSEKLDFSLPAARQKPASGYVPRRSLTLVRNPAWDSGTDSLRPAYVDRIEIVAEAPDEAAEKVDSGELDLVWDLNAPLEQMRRYQADSRLAHRLFRDPADFVWALAMNLATPPFDDLRVRRAVAYSVDKEAVRRLFGSRAFTWGPGPGQIAGHVAPDSVTKNLLFSYDAFATPGNEGDANQARREMAQSRYDRNRDGRCDHPVCTRVRLVIYEDGPLPGLAASLEKDLARVGIRLEPEVVPDFEAAFETYGDPRQRIGLAIDAWSRDYPSGAAFFVPAFSGRAIAESGNRNLSLLGATSEQLERWDFPVSSVPSVDERITRCLRLWGRAQLECWAELDQYISARLVAWVPLLQADSVVATSSRVVGYTVSQFNCYSALEQIALAPGSS